MKSHSCLLNITLFEEIVRVFIRVHDAMAVKTGFDKFPHKTYQVNSLRKKKTLKKPTRKFLHEQTPQVEDIVSSMILRAIKFNFPTVQIWVCRFHSGQAWNRIKSKFLGWRIFNTANDALRKCLAHDVFRLQFYSIIEI